MKRTLNFNIFRYNPQDPASHPHMESYTLQETAGMTLFIALNQIRELQAPSLAFDFVCRAGVCGSCSMLINGRPRLACRTLTESLPDTITLLPLPTFELIADLSVNSGKWMRAMSERLETWVHSVEETDLDRIELPMDPDLAEHIYELDRCIECGCCDVVCPSHLPLTQYFRWGKSQLHKQFIEHERAEHARQRFEARNVRLEKQKAERQARLAAKREALEKARSDSGRRAAIDEIMARKNRAADENNEPGQSE